MIGEAIRVPDELKTEGLLSLRYVARLMDAGFISLSVLAATLAASALLPSIGGTAGLILTSVLPAFVVWIGYEVVFEWSPWQATIGKRLVGLKVCNSQGGRMTLAQAARRNLVKDSPFLLLGYLPKGYILSLLWLGAHLLVVHRGSTHRAIHDRVADTWVTAGKSVISL
jgi:uncharacterized RDD family membrane protein YckC